MKQTECRTVALQFYKRRFHKLVHQLGYVGAIDYMDSHYLLWGDLKNEVFQWYDFEILGVSYG